MNIISSLHVMDLMFSHYFYFKIFFSDNLCDKVLDLILSIHYSECKLQIFLITSCIPVSLYPCITLYPFIPVSPCIPVCLYHPVACIPVSLCIPVYLYPCITLNPCITLWPVSLYTSVSLYPCMSCKV